MKNKILILDDDKNILILLETAINMKYQAYCATSIKDGMKIVEEEEIDICLCDIRIGTDNGIDFLAKVKDYNPHIGVIMITAYGDIQTSVKAMKLGAFHYLTKPLDLEELFLTIDRALELKTLTQRVREHDDEMQDLYGTSRMIGQSTQMQHLHHQIDRLGKSSANVLIVGESGTGKELVARALHYSGMRKKARFVAINCAAIPATMLEEEMFGHKKGAFTGAISDTKGKFEYANNGTIFLDEVAEIPLALQAKLLRVLEEKEFFPIGSNESRKVDVRIVAATNQDLGKMVNDGKFRQDLLFRLNVITLKTPSLRERREDIPLLIKHYIERFNREQNKMISGISEGALDMLLQYSFPGNIRELINIIEYSTIFAERNMIHICDLPDSVVSKQKKTSSTSARDYQRGKTISEMEREMIADTLKETEGHIGRAATILGLSDKGLRNKIKAYGIDSSKK